MFVFKSSLDALQAHGIINVIVDIHSCIQGSFLKQAFWLWKDYPVLNKIEWINE